MPIPQSRERIAVAFGASGTYRIQVQGRLDENWSDRLGGMKITREKQEGGTWVTTLSGRLPDEAALLGVQTALYELHLPLLSVERIENEVRCPQE
jgi:hypothetical protein